MKHQPISHIQETSVHCPLREIPEWAPFVPRWNQLDPAATALAEMAWQNRKAQTQLPSMIFIACPTGSSVTDQRFATAISPSPTLFVHTLPSSRAQVLCQVLEWSGPIVCFAQGPQTFEWALEEAKLRALGALTSLWIFEVWEGNPIQTEGVKVRFCNVHDAAMMAPK